MSASPQNYMCVLLANSVGLGTGTSWNAVPIDALLGASSTRCYRTMQSLHMYCTDPYVGRGMCATFHNLAIFLLKFHIQTLRR